MTGKQVCRKDIRELKRMIAALTHSYKAILRMELKPLQRRLARLEAKLARKRGKKSRTIAEVMGGSNQTWLQ